MIALLWLGCGGPTDPAAVTLEVFAATSLTDAFADLAEGFEATHPGVDVRLTLAGSQVLRLQIDQGAAADVFASADPRHLEALVDDGQIVAAEPLADNGLVVVVPSDDPARITRFDELPYARRIVVGSPESPVGAYTRALLERAGAQYGLAFEEAVARSIVSEESNVRLVRAKVELGEADAAIVYRTDVSDGVRAVPVPEELDVRARYPIGLLARSRVPEVARSFVEFVRSDEGGAVLERHGFLQPEGCDGALE